MEEFIIDFDNPKETHQFFSKCRLLRRKMKIQMCIYRKSRTGQQNRYYRGVHVPMFADWIRAEWGDPVTEEAAHHILAEKFLKASTTNHNTGETWEYVRSTADLNVEEFSIYLEQVAQFLAEYCGIVVPPASGWIDPAPASKGERAA